MSNFLNNLLKGFVRSAVNQVGKDGGKVISNQIYGNNHATPVNITSTNTTQTNTDDTPTQENNNVPFSFWHYAFKDYLLLKLLLYYVLGFFIIIYFFKDITNPILNQPLLRIIHYICE